MNLLLASIYSDRIVYRLGSGAAILACRKILAEAKVAAHIIPLVPVLFGIFFTHQWEEL